MLAAEHYLAAESDSSIRLLSQKMAFRKDVLRRLWPAFINRIRLEPDPLRQIEDNFRYLQKTDQNFENVVMPDFRNLFDASFLQKVAPDRVNREWK